MTTAVVSRRAEVIALAALRRLVGKGWRVEIRIALAGVRTLRFIIV